MELMKISMTDIRSCEQFPGSMGTNARPLLQYPLSKNSLLVPYQPVQPCSYIFLEFIHNSLRYFIQLTKIFFQNCQIQTNKLFKQTKQKLQIIYAWQGGTNFNTSVDLLFYLLCTYVNAFYIALNYLSIYKHTYESYCNLLYLPIMI